MISICCGHYLSSLQSVGYSPTRQLQSLYLSNLADNIIYSLQKGSSMAKRPWFNLSAFYTVTSSVPSNMHKWNNKNKNMPLLDVASAILGVIFESFSHFRPLEWVTKSHRFQWFPSSFILQVLQVRFLTLVTYTHPMPLVYKCQINSSVNPVLFKWSVLIETSHLGIQILLNLTLLFLTNLISHLPHLNFLPYLYFTVHAAPPWPSFNNVILQNWLKPFTELPWLLQPRVGTSSLSDTQYLLGVLHPLILRPFLFSVTVPELCGSNK